MNSYFFVGVAGVGMSALAQFLAGKGKNCSGSDRRFASEEGAKIKQQLEEAGVKCYLQDGSGVTKDLDTLVVSTAIENGNPDTQAAKNIGIPIIHRSELLAKICKENDTIAVSGTSGKSTVVGMIWHILNENKKDPSLLSGAGLTALEEQGKIGNAVAGTGWLVAEADESDGTLIKYFPKIGIILNIDKDHKELEELEKLFAEFAANVRKAGGTLIVNKNHPLAKKIADKNTIFFEVKDYKQKGLSSEFDGVQLPLPGKYNAENAAAAIAACKTAGLNENECKEALKTYKGIHRRCQIYQCKNDIILVDDYAHNPAKIAASIRSVQGFAKGKVYAWFQPHGFGPTKFLKDDFIKEITAALRPTDEIYFSSIYYAGGTADRTFDSNIISDALTNGHFIPNRTDCLKEIISKAKSGDVILLMGARDPSLAEFAKHVFDTLQS